MKRYFFLLSFVLSSLCFTEELALLSSNIGLPTSFHDIGLGMAINEVKELLKDDPSFAYRGDRDVSLLNNKNRSLIEANGVHFVKRGSFQFYDEKLYTIIIQMNPENIDYYSIYSSLVEKYGEPSMVDQKKSLWEDDHVRLVLERPLTLKYIELSVFKEIIESRNKKEAMSEEIRERFIRAF
jgi:hypothetical protein